jgi:hypothetical protein
VGAGSDALPQMKEAGLNLLKLLLISTLLVTTGKLSWDAGLAIGLIFLLPLDWRPRVFFTPHFVSFGADVGRLRHGPRTQAVVMTGTSHPR